MTRKFLFLAVMFFLSPVFILCAEEKGVSAYYFHGTARCPTCHKIEQYSKEALEKYFKPELESGKLTFKTVNVEEKGNEHYVNDYQLYTKSLILSFVKDGAEIKSKNLTQIWELTGNKEKFQHYVKEETAAFLKESYG